MRSAVNIKSEESLVLLWGVKLLHPETLSQDSRYNSGQQGMQSVRVKAHMEGRWRMQITINVCSLWEDILCTSVPKNYKHCLCWQTHWFSFINHLNVCVNVIFHNKRQHLSVLPSFSQICLKCLRERRIAFNTICNSNSEMPFRHQGANFPCPFTSTGDCAHRLYISLLTGHHAVFPFCIECRPKGTFQFFLGIPTAHNWIKRLNCTICCQVMLLFFSRLQIKTVSQIYVYLFNTNLKYASYQILKKLSVKQFYLHHGAQLSNKQCHPPPPLLFTQFFVHLCVSAISYVDDQNYSIMQVEQ